MTTARIFCLFFTCLALAAPASAGVSVPSLSIDDVTVNEAGTATFTVSLSSAFFQNVTVDFATANGTATTPSDYASKSGTLTFLPEETTKQITVTLVDDSSVESDETFFVNLTNPTNATISDGQGLGTIQNNDKPGLTPFLRDDAATVSVGVTTLSPLANDVDPEGDLLSLVSVSAPSVTIRGRDLLIPSTFTGNFTYTATDGTAEATATVTVTQKPAIVRPDRYSGLLYKADGTVSGSLRLFVNPRGSTTLQITNGARRGTGNFTLTRTGATAATSIGSLVLVRNADGTMNATLAGTNGPLTGLLRPGPKTARPHRHHIALSSVGNFMEINRDRQVAAAPIFSDRIPGGGYAIARVRRNAEVVISGKLPDGTPFSSGTALNDVDGIAFYAVTVIGVSPRGYVGGQLTLADLPLTDVTGELKYFKASQSAQTYTHRSGIDTILQANGCVYAGVRLSGGAFLTLLGGNLEEDEFYFTNVLNNRVSRAGLLTDWAAIQRHGTFLARVAVPWSRVPVLGSGVFLPKSNSAWGYFRGQNEGGRIDLRLAGEDEE